MVAIVEAVGMEVVFAFEGFASAIAIVAVVAPPGAENVARWLSDSLDFADFLPVQVKALVELVICSLIWDFARPRYQ